jgi:hypothetical protein
VPWIFATPQDQTALSGIMKAGFSHEFTMRRRRRFLGLLQRVETVHKAVASLSSLSSSLRDCVHSEN